VVGDGDDVAALRARCGELGITEAVQFEGRVSDARLAELYGDSIALVLPSVADPDASPPTGEGLGLVYGEAGAFGIPSIASTASGGAAELVRDGETGLTVPPDQPDALAAAMTTLLSDQILCTRLGEAARARVLARHTPAAFRSALQNALGGR
jgi:phosphatidylinositol alpha-1,6-mannosyltransferase